MAKLTNLKARLKVWLDPLTSWRAALDELKPNRKPSSVKLGPAFHSQQDDFGLDPSQVGKIKMSAIFRFICGQNFEPWVKYEDDAHKQVKRKNHWGLLDYLTAGVLRAVESLFRGDWIKNPKARKIVFWSACLVWAPLAVARYSISVALMLLALPIGGIIWAVWEKRQKAKNPTKPDDPNEVTPNKPLEVGDKVTIKKSDKPGAQFDWDKVPPLHKLDTYYRVKKITNCHMEATVVSTTAISRNPDYFTEQKYYKVVLHDESVLGMKYLPGTSDLQVRALKNFGVMRDKKRINKDPSKPTINRTHFDPHPEDKMEKTDTFAYFGRHH